MFTGTELDGEGGHAVQQPVQRLNELGAALLHLQEGDTFMNTGGVEDVDGTGGHEPLPMVTFTLATPDTDTIPDPEVATSWSSALSTALSLSALSFSMNAAEAFQSRQENIRDCLVQFMLQNASACFHIFDGISIQDAFRKSYVLANEPDTLTTSDGEVKVLSWHEYTQLLLLPSTVLDPAAMQIAALLFKVQIVLVNGTMSAVLNPDDGHRRIFLRVFDNNAVEWMCPAEDVPSSDSPLRTVDITIQSDLLAFSSTRRQEIQPADPHALSKPQHLSHFNNFHCGCTVAAVAEPRVELVVEREFNDGGDPTVQQPVQRLNEPGAALGHFQKGDTFMNTGVVEDIDGTGGDELAWARCEIREMWTWAF
jgi:hypothetical protein